MGFILWWYGFAVLPLLIKVGRYAEPLTPLDKERHYRRLVPDFKMHHAYDTEDMVAEEARVLSHLRLVAGTAVSGAGQENFKISLQDAVAGANPSQLENIARKAIYELRVDDSGKNVSKLLEELNANMCDPDMDAIKSLSRNGNIKDALYRVGLKTASARPEHGLSVAVYGFVFDAKRLLKVLPALKPCLTVLPGLTL